MQNTTDFQRFINMVRNGMKHFEGQFKENETSCLFFTAKKKGKRVNFDGAWIGNTNYIKVAIAHVILDIILKENPKLKAKDNERLNDILDDIYNEISDYIALEIHGHAGK